MNDKWIKILSADIFTEIYSAHKMLTSTKNSLSGNKITKEELTNKFADKFINSHEIREQLADECENNLIKILGPMIENILKIENEQEEIPDFTDSLIEYSLISAESYYQKILQNNIDIENFSIKNFFIINRYVSKITTLIFLIKSYEKIYISEKSRRKKRVENIERENTDILFPILKQNIDNICKNKKHTNKGYNLSNVADNIRDIIKENNPKNPENVPTEATIKNWLKDYLGITAKNINFLPEKIKNL